MEDAMRAPSVVLSLTLGAALACSNPLPPESLRGTWVSDSASLTVTDTSATLLLLTSGGCFGSYGQVAQAIFSDRFTLPGTFIQLIGAYPGKLEYAAQFAGQVDGPNLRLTIDVPTLPLALGPLRLTSGVSPGWSPCEYP